jgi:lysylphosphatidylglycerol synthetase-like protein (DUF2156 family)
MSHIPELSELEFRCNISGECSEYYGQLNQQQLNIDSQTAHANQIVLVWGVIIGMIGLIVLLTPFVKRLQRLQMFILPKLAIVSPLVAAVISGVAAGMYALLGACFGQRCSTSESWSWFVVPIVIALMLAAPVARAFYRRRKNIAKAIAHIKPLSWIIVGTLIILLALNRTVYHISQNNTQKNLNKSSLQNLD